MSDVPMKKCKKCGITKPVQAFGLRKDSKDGLEYRCKTCRGSLKTRDTVTPRPEGMKNCSKCGELKFLEEFTRNKKRKDGYGSHCKTCKGLYYSENVETIRQKGAEYRKENLESIRARGRQRYHENPQRSADRLRAWRTSNASAPHLIHNDGLKRCGKCKQLLSVELFPKNRGLLDGLSGTCKLCLKAWNKNNPEKVKAWSRAYRERNRNILRQKNALRRQANPGKYKYYKKHPNRHRIHANNRRARKRNLPDTLTTTQWRDCLNYFNHRCAVCGRPKGFWHTLAQEHWQALADPRPDNPGTVATNILPMCHSIKDGTGGCNNSKGNLDPIEWLYSRWPKKEADVILARIEAYFEWVRQQPE